MNLSQMQVVFLLAAFLLSFSTYAQVENRQVNQTQNSAQDTLVNLEQNSDESKVKTAAEPAAKTKTPRKKPTYKKWIIGGSVGLQFGSVTSIMVAPTIGYRILKPIALYVQPSYSFYKDKRGVTDYETNMWGINVYTRIKPLKWLFFHAGYEKYFYTDSLGKSRKPNSLVLGAGYYKAISRNAGLSLLVAYDVLQEKYSVYGNSPIIQLGVTIGI